MSDELQTLGVADMCKAFGLKPRALRYLRKAKNFPPKLPLPGRPRWSRAAVESFLGQRDLGEVVIAEFVERCAAEVKGKRPEEVFALLKTETCIRLAEAHQEGNGARERFYLRLLEILDPLDPMIVRGAKQFARNLAHEAP